MPVTLNPACHSAGSASQTGRFSICMSARTTLDLSQTPEEIVDVAVPDRSSLPSSARSKWSSPGMENAAGMRSHWVLDRRCG